MALRPSIREVLEGLQREGHLDPGMDASARTALEVRQHQVATTPWFVKAFAGFGAWVAASFLLSFFGCMGILDEKEALIALGLMMCGGATALRRKTAGPFLEQLALAVCLAGASMMVVGTEMVTRDDVTFAIVQVLVSGVLLLVYPDAILRFLSTLGVTWGVCILAWKVLGGLGLDLWTLCCAALLFALVLQEARLLKSPWGAWVGPVSFALTADVAGRLLLRSFDDVVRELTREHRALPHFVLTLALTALVLVAAWRVLKEQGERPTSPAGLTVVGALGLLALMTLNTPGVIAAVGLLVLGFHRRSQVMLGLAVAFLLAFGSIYYYDLQLSLLAKSLALLGSGLVMLGARQVLLRHAPVATTEVR